MSLAKSIADVWEGNATLCGLVPFSSVFTGRVPQTQQYPFPYVSVLLTSGRYSYRTDKCQGSHAPVSFHIWVDDSALEDGLAVAKAIEDVYANRCWTVDDTTKVIDVIDEGPAVIHQGDIPSVKAWEVVKLFTVCVERTRATHTDTCCDTSSQGQTSSSP